jgi:RNA-dependent RNA polymerase
MQLRKSMKKFENHTEEWADIEIARAFDYPNLCYLNRPLVMLLEDRNVRREAFERLQQEAVQDVMTIDQSTENLIHVLRNNSLGAVYRLAWIVERIQELLGSVDLVAWDNLFWSRLRSVAVNHVLRDIKHRARIRIPDSYVRINYVDILLT